MWNQRSVDTLLGLPFNILSYAILTYMIAQCVNMDVDELIFNGGDVHIYENQITAFKEQVNRSPHKYALPHLKLNPDIKDIEADANNGLCDPELVDRLKEQIKPIKQKGVL